MSTTQEWNLENLQEQNEYMERVKKLLSERYDHPPLAYTKTFGCQANVSDGERIKGLLGQMGYGFTDNLGESDLVLYNTCAVRKSAEDRVYGRVGALQHWKQERRERIVAVCGCMMQQEQAAQKIRRSYPYVDLVFGPQMLHRLPQMLYETMMRGKRVFHLETGDTEIPEGLPVQRDGKYKAWVQIMRGCDNFCSYCIVPYVRGREQSRRPGPILDEIRELVASGYKEITLLGQNVNSYGKGLDDPISFAELLRRIDALEGDFRVRFMTSHPKDCTTELIDVIAAGKKLCHHIHLPVQSGSDRVLERMNRRYTSQSYLSLVRYAREKIPDVEFTSDIIVGFPSETYEDFAQTLDLIRQVRYSALYMFIFSPREGTKAALMDDPVPYAEKNRWFQELQAQQNEIGSAYNQSLVGKTLRVLAEDGAHAGEGYLCGRSDANTIVEFPASADLVGQFVYVRVTKAMNWAVMGEQILTDR